MLMADPYEKGVLVKEHHEQLVADLEGYARDAGILPHSIYNPLPDDLPDVARNYLIAFKRNTSNGVHGLALTGKDTGSRVEGFMSAMAGALVRNFIRARVVTLGTVLDMLAAKDMPDISCLLIPNFFLSASEGGTVAPWQVNALYDYLTDRHVSGLQTVIYASDLSLMGKEYGLAFKRHVDVHYLRTGI